MRTFLLPLAAALLASIVPVAAQGPLTPPGAPAATMKTLDQIEPRTAIPGGSAAVTISKRGSYYLTGNLEVTGGDAITVQAPDVSLDLNGFTVSTTAVGVGRGIMLFAAASRPTIINGKLTAFAEGINGTAVVAGRYEGLSASHCTQAGLNLGRSSIVQRCTAFDNEGAVAIGALNGSTMTDCVATENVSSKAISAGAGSTVKKCTAYFNQCVTGISVGSGSTVSDCAVGNNIAPTTGSGTPAGILAADECTVSNSSAHTNPTDGIRVGNRSNVSNCVATSNGTNATGHGIVAADRTTIKDCTSTLNAVDGIRIGGDCIVIGNLASANSSGIATGAGIRSAGTGNRIENNQVRNGLGRGIAGSVNDVIIRNTAGGNAGENFTAASQGAFFGPVQQPSNATSPVANTVF